MRSKYFRKTKQYKVWKDKILKRDKHTCQVCKSKKDIQVHHIFPLRIPGYSYSFLKSDSGIVLCEKCHRMEQEASRRLEDKRWLKEHPDKIQKYIDNLNKITDAYNRIMLKKMKKKKT